MDKFGSERTREYEAFDAHRCRRNKSLTREEPYDFWLFVCTEFFSNRTFLGPERLTLIKFCLSTRSDFLSILDRLKFVPFQPDLCSKLHPKQDLRVNFRPPWMLKKADAILSFILPSERQKLHILEEESDEFLTLHLLIQSEGESGFLNI